MNSQKNSANAPLIMATDVVAEMQNRYPDKVALHEQSQWLNGVDAGYQLAINEMLSIIEGEIKDESE